MANESFFGVPNGDIPAQGNTVIFNPSPFIPSPGFGTIQSNVGSFYRVGDRLVGRVQFVPGTVGAANAYLTLPKGLTINRGVLKDLNIVAPGATVRTWQLGTYLIVSPPAGGQIALYATAALAGAMFYDNVDPTKMFMTYTSIDGAWQKQGTNGIFSSTYVVECTFDIPIAEWAV